MAKQDAAEDCKARLSQTILEIDKYQGQTCYWLHYGKVSSLYVSPLLRFCLSKNFNQNVYRRSSPIYIPELHEQSGQIGSRLVLDATILFLWKSDCFQQMAINIYRTKLKVIKQLLFSIGEALIFMVFFVVWSTHKIKYQQLSFSRRPSITSIQNQWN